MIASKFQSAKLKKWQYIPKIFLIKKLNANNHFHLLISKLEIKLAQENSERFMRVDTKKQGFCLLWKKYLSLR